MNAHADKMALFAEVVDAGSFTSAARKLGMPKSSVSERISQLENHLELRLLNRSTRKLSLTWAGEQYLEQCREVLILLRQSEQKIQEIKDRVQGEIRITAAGRFVEIILPKLLADFQRHHPEVSFDVIVNDSALDLVANRFDIAFRTGEKLRDSNLISYQLGENKKLLVASEQYLVRNPIQSIDDLTNAQTIVHPGYREWHFSSKKSKKTIRPKYVIQANSMILARNICAQNGGVSVLAEELVRHDTGADRLVHILPDWEVTPNKLFIVYPSRKFNSPAFKAFIDFVIREHS